jgi:hypothetical protein
MQTLHEFMIKIGEIYFWAMILQLQPTLPLFKVLCSLDLAISYSPLHSPLLILLHYSFGVSIATSKRVMNKVSRLYLQAHSNISTLMETKVEKILSECSRQLTGLSSGSCTTLEHIQVNHFVLHEAFSMVKKWLLLNIQVKASTLVTQELL